MEAPRNRDGRRPGRPGFRQAHPEVPRSHDGRRGEEVPRGRPVPGRQHGPEGRGRRRIPGEGRAARDHHGPGASRPRGRRQGRHATRADVSAEGFSPPTTFAACRWRRSRSGGTRTSSDPTISSGTSTRRPRPRSRRSTRSSISGRADASWTSPAGRAARQAGVKATFVQGDMRRLRYRNAFDAAISMFTSFGYFDRPDEDREVLRGIGRALRPRGKFLMELFNRDSLVAGLPSQNWQARDDGTVVLEDASFDLLRGRFETRQVIIDRKGTREFTASVRAYTLAELKEMLDAEGLFVHRVLGGLDLSPYTARSRRMVLYAVKGLEPEGIRTVW